MKVYIVQGHTDYEGFDILGVFDTKEKATDFHDDSASSDEWDYDWYSIAEYEVI
jgi:hypothetical protein